MSLDVTLLMAKAKEAYEQEEYETAYADVQEALLISEEVNLEALQLATFLAYEHIKDYAMGLEYATQFLTNEPFNFTIRLKRGWIYLELNQYEEAAADFQFVIDETTSDDETVYAVSGRAVANYFLNKYEEAIADFENCLPHYPRWATGYADYGWALTNLGRYAEGIVQFNKALEQGDYPFAAAGLGVAQYELGDYDLAIDNLTIALVDSPDWIRGLAVRGWCYNEIQYYENASQLALVDLNRALELDPDYLFAYAGRGLTYYTLGDYQQSLADLERTIEENKKWYRGHAVMAWDYLFLEEYEKAIQTANLAIVDDADEPYLFAYAARGIACYELDKHEASVADLKIAVDGGFGWPRAVATRGWAYAELGLDIEQTDDNTQNAHYEEALKYFTLILDRNPDYLYARGGRGLVHYYLNQYEEAIADLDETLASNDTWRRGYNTRGWAKYYLADTPVEYQAALVDFQEAAKHSETPSNFNISGMAMCYYQLQDYQQAITYLEQVVDEYPKWTNGWCALGWSYYKQEQYLTKNSLLKPKKFQKALDIFAKFTKTNGENYRTSYYSAMVYDTRQDYEKSLAAYERAYELEPFSCLLGNMAEFYRYGKGVKKDEQEAFIRYQKAYELQEAEKNCSCINVQLFDVYYRGIGTTKDETKAFSYLNLADDDERVGVLLRRLYSYLILQGIYFDYDVQRAIKLLEQNVETDIFDTYSWYMLYVVYTKFQPDDMKAQHAKQQVEETIIGCDIYDHQKTIKQALKNKQCELIYPVQ